MSKDKVDILLEITGKLDKKFDTLSDHFTTMSISYSGLSQLVNDHISEEDGKWKTMEDLLVAWESMSWIRKFGWKLMVAIASLVVTLISIWKFYFE